MITKVEALRFRCLKYVGQTLKRVNVFLGPNASGKSTFLDVIAFLADLVRIGPEQAVKLRTDNIVDLFWKRTGSNFELAIELAIPADIRNQLAKPEFDTVRYEVRIGYLDETGTSTEFGILGERLFLQSSTATHSPHQQRSLFPELPEERRVYTSTKNVPLGKKQVLHKKLNDNFYSEVLKNKGGGWLPSFKFGPQKSALANLPDDGSRFPVATWLRSFLTQDIQEISLNGRSIREASPPGQDRRFLRDGSNLPWVIENLRRDHESVFHDWIEHVRVAFPDIESIKVHEREDTKHRYLIVKYLSGAEVPSWMVSDGTLRFLALTLLTYLQDSHGTFLIEEPENGIHPRAIGYLFEAFSTVETSQLLLATHSPIAIGLVERNQILCFAKIDGATDIVNGEEHPALRDWDGDGSLGGLFASGILG